MTIFDLIKSPELVAYWDETTKGDAPFLGETLFPNKKQLSIELKWIKGASGLPVVLAPSAYDVKAVPVARGGFDILSAQMPFFKNSKYIDEELRQQLNMVIATGNQAYIDTLINKIFDDELSLIKGAAAQRERMRMMALTTGAIAITANGQSYAYDYGMPDSHKVETTKAWSDPSADIGNDLQTWQDKIEEDTGVKPTRAICDGTTFNYLLNNTKFKNAIYVMANGNVTITEDVIKNHIKSVYGISVEKYTKMYKTEAGVPTKYVPADTFVLFPEGYLGYSNFGTTPEESDLMSNPSVANVAIADTGVAVTTTTLADPVQVETKVSMVFMPSFEEANKVIIADVSHTGN